MAHPLLFFLLSLLTIIPYSSNGAEVGMQTKELSALFQLMDSLLLTDLDHPTWSQLHPHPCTDTPWPGLQCELIQPDPFLHVTKIHIGADLTASSPPPPQCKPTAHLPASSLLNLPFLKSLSLFSCFLHNNNVTLSPSLFTPSSSSSSSLQQLVLKSNPGLTGQIPPTLSLLKSLRVLSLSQNGLSGDIPGEIFGGLTSLQQLDLSYNHLTGRIPQEIGGLTSLTIFDLSFNQLEGQIPWSIGQLAPTLEKLDLSSNSLSDRIPAELGRLQWLVLLDLSHNSITGPLPESLSGLRELQYLIMEGNPIGSGVPGFVGGLKKLSVVGLSDCGLLGPIPDCFGSLESLTALALDRNRLNGSVPSSLGSLPRLGQLNLSQNELSGEIDFGEEFVSRLGNRLDVRENKGLCTNPHLGLRAPPCLNGSHETSEGSADDSYKDLRDEGGRKKGSCDDEEQSSSSSSRTSSSVGCGGGGAIFGFERVGFCGVEIFVILSFVVCVINN